MQNISFFLYNILFFYFIILNIVINRVLIVEVVLRTDDIKNYKKKKSKWNGFRGQKA